MYHGDDTAELSPLSDVRCAIRVLAALTIILSSAAHLDRRCSSALFFIRSEM